MKKTIVFSAMIVMILIQSTNLFAGGGGHRAYVKHSKHHKAHKVHKAHGRIDATYN